MILKYPDPKLQKVSSEVTDFKEAEIIANELVKVTKSVDNPLRFWLGLSAPQIGHNKRIILIKASRGNYKVMVNPYVIKVSKTIPTLSKCFSVKGLYILKNPFWIKQRYQDLNGNYHEGVFKGGKAVVLQQELDHLDGILISDRGVKII